jgi:hypothetical protein
MRNLLSAASSGAVSNVFSRIPDHATVLVSALWGIFVSTAPEPERQQAAIAYVRDDDAARQAADRWPGEIADSEHQIADQRPDEGHAQADLFGQQPSTNPLFGLKVKPPNSCRRCGAPVAIVGVGKGPHVASLVCKSCGSHGGWLSRANHTFLNEVIDKNGAPPREPIALPSVSKPEKNGDGVSVVHHGMKRG